MWDVSLAFLFMAAIGLLVSPLSCVSPYERFAQVYDAALWRFLKRQVSYLLRVLV